MAEAKRSNSISKTFLRGVGVVTPVILTAYLIYVTLVWAEDTFSHLFLLVIPAEYYVAGLGVVAAALIVFLIGWSVSFLPTDPLAHLFNSIIDRIPIVRTIYSSFKDFADFLGGDSAEKFAQAVVVEVPDTKAHLLGYITSREVTDDLGIEDDDSLVVVYLPMSYQLGGYMAIVPKDWVKEVKLSSEAALKYVLTAGVSKKKNKSG